MTEKRKEEIRSFAKMWAGRSGRLPWSPSPAVASCRDASGMLIECLDEIERLQNFSEEKARRAAQLDAYIAAFEICHDYVQFVVEEKCGSSG